VVKRLSLFSQNGNLFIIRIDRVNNIKIEYLKLTSFKFLNFDKVGGMLVSLLELKISVSSLVSCPSSEGIIPVIDSVSFMTKQ
jgi:hypothetical protein